MKLLQYTTISKTKTYFGYRTCKIDFLVTIAHVKSFACVLCSTTCTISSEYGLKNTRVRNWLVWSDTPISLLISINFCLNQSLKYLSKNFFDTN